MAKVKPNYTPEEYLLLIQECESSEELRLIGEQIEEDKRNRCFPAFDYIDVRIAFSLRLISLSALNAGDLF